MDLTVDLESSDEEPATPKPSIKTNTMDLRVDVESSDEEPTTTKPRLAAPFMPSIGSSGSVPAPSRVPATIVLDHSDEEGSSPPRRLVFDTGRVPTGYITLDTDSPPPPPRKKPKLDSDMGQGNELRSLQPATPRPRFQHAPLPQPLRPDPGLGPGPQPAGPRPQQTGPQPQPPGGAARPAAPRPAPGAARHPNADPEGRPARQPAAARNPPLLIAPEDSNSADDENPAGDMVQKWSAAAALRGHPPPLIRQNLGRVPIPVLAALKYCELRSRLLNDADAAEELRHLQDADEDDAEDDQRGADGEDPEEGAAQPAAVALQNEQSAALLRDLFASRCFQDSKHENRKLVIFFADQLRRLSAKVPPSVCKNALLQRPWLMKLWDERVDGAHGQLPLKKDRVKIAKWAGHAMAVQFLTEAPPGAAAGVLRPLLDVCLQARTGMNSGPAVQLLKRQPGVQVGVGAFGPAYPADGIVASLYPCKQCHGAVKQPTVAVALKQCVLGGWKSWLHAGGFCQAHRGEQQQ